MNTDQIRQQFMEKMDSLWVDEFDVAFDKIPGGDGFAFKRYADLLDEFFVCYWHFFEGWANGAKPDYLNQIAITQYDESIRKLETVWRNTIDAQIRKAEELKEKRARFLPPLLSIFQKADALLKEVRKAATIQERIDKYRQAAGLFETFIRRPEVAS